ncbi:pentapeptide repeat-containing protein [Nocardia sp. NPDC004568]|uniref:pentapeptide repeat-containing protein n=1 Tax=Nocardia sp. NPDC004568 TaxID=3154551 RepID=UPI0033BAF251
MIAALAAVGALYFTNSTLIATNEQLGLTRRTAQSEQIKSAAEQLDSDKTSVRLSGIYLLERLAQDSEPDRSPLRRLLEAFVRTEAPSGTCGPHNRELPADINAALAVIVQYSALSPPAPSVDLHASCLAWARMEAADLTGANLRYANLVRAWMGNANLTEASLFHANLAGAWMGDANLTGAELVGADLTKAGLGDANLAGARLYDANLAEAVLIGANLTGASLGGANLTQASLGGANLTGASLGSANLTGARLFGANLTGASLIGANLTEIAYDDSTVWPEGFAPPPSAYF